MMHEYRVWYDNEVVFMCRAFSKDDAINRAYMKLGSASKYTGRSRDNFFAEKL